MEDEQINYIEKGIQHAEEIGALSFGQGAKMRDLIKALRAERKDAAYWKNAALEHATQHTDLQNKVAAEISRFKKEIIALEGVAEIMDCGHERRFSTLQIGATDNKSVCTACEVERLTKEKAQLRIDQALLRRGFSPTALAENERLRAALDIIASVVYGAYIFEGDTYAHTSTVETLRHIAKEALKGGEG